ncbi:DUF1269 domain-containing protein [Streptomyces acidiscabies]|uniref:DUF1269 domain-containing protein n=3 Tax=Streptomyces acidiscabies TaxID=42234 RepID=A0AAP6BCQ2_9ACTN|nr:DUF1269 domain-containing protein [Streptomyces acidiscabies]MBP5938496.1 DUF1269 domain-containing protein [Streptomyces sp. LBUM 1476]MBZ3909601.1 DUF1269 domain-containing protein [Streptomyces acidiscabies]MDX2962230.1 DUF1269 domain-containing protein [Streptomyces acidiscabies]MDX3019682.1 DUF1269 domain-containing protein [Streptomyces acidiscabies]MDX3792249.1 DUF1269 domain-containing protein [Streptomyces acidiscabies]
MTDMIAISYPTQDVARQALTELRALQTEHTVQVADAVLLTRDLDGKVTLHGRPHPAASGALGGAFWGGLVGLLLLQPLLGAAIGAAAGGVAGATAEDDDRTQFIKSLGERLAPGTAAVIAVIGEATADKALPRIARYGGEVLHTSLSQQDEDEIRHALHAEQPAGKWSWEDGATKVTPQNTEQHSDSSGMGAAALGAAGGLAGGVLLGALLFDDDSDDD